MFVIKSAPLFRQAKNMPGNISVQSRSKRLLEYWTLTCWESQEHLANFALKGAHKKVIGKARYFSDDFESARWSVSEIPRWDDAEKQLAKSHK